jgi:hypothetical protein
MDDPPYVPIDHHTLYPSSLALALSARVSRSFAPPRASTSTLRPPAHAWLFSQCPTPVQLVNTLPPRGTPRDPIRERWDAAVTGDVPACGSRRVPAPSGMCDSEHLAATEGSEAVQL